MVPRWLVLVVVPLAGGCFIEPAPPGGDTSIPSCPGVVFVIGETLYSLPTGDNFDPDEREDRKELWVVNHTGSATNDTDLYVSRRADSYPPATAAASLDTGASEMTSSSCSTTARPATTRCTASTGRRRRSPSPPSTS